MKLLKMQVRLDDDTTTLVIDPVKNLINLVKNSQFFSFKSNTRQIVIIAAQNLGHAMSIAQSINLGPCIIQALDQKDGCTLYINQYLDTKKRIA